MSAKPKVLFTDGEGPLVFKDIAFDAAASKIPEGEIIFNTISAYVGWASESGNSYQPGETLSFLTAHLLAHGVTDADLHEEARNLQIANGADSYVPDLYSDGWTIRVISTAYPHLWDYASGILGIPRIHIANTLLSLDELRESSWKSGMTEQVLRAEEEILARRLQLSDIFEMRKKGMSLEEAFSKKPLQDCERALVHLHRAVLPSFGFNPPEKVTVVGGNRKIDAVKIFANELKMEPQDIVYVGDSITDDRTNKWVRENGGLSIAVNGDEYAIRNAVVAVATQDMRELKPILETWINAGHEAVRRLVEGRSPISIGNERQISQEAPKDSHFSMVEGSNVAELAEIGLSFKRRMIKSSAVL